MNKALLDAFRVFGECFPGVFFCLSDDGMAFGERNDRFLRLAGCSGEELLQQFPDGFGSFVDIRDRDAVLQEIEKADTEWEAEFRLAVSGKMPRWLSCRGHRMEGGWLCTAEDVTRDRETERELRHSLKQHQIILDQTTDILFEWDVAADTFSFSGNWAKKFATDLITQNVSRILDHAPHVYPEDQPVFADMLRKMMKGERYLERSLRLVDGGQKVLWHRMRLTGLTDEAGNFVRAVGVITDIDAERLAAQRLLDRAQRDSLTHLYNKGTCQELVEQALSGREAGKCSVLILLDLDDFKVVNDTHGHLFGDAVLSEAAQVLQKQFRREDIIGRIGGDEFLVFLTGIPGIALAEQKVGQAIRALCSVMKNELGDSCCSISCSAGIAAASDGITYHELFQNADKALYRAKSLGKNRYCVFDPQGAEMGFLPGVQRNATPIDSEKDGELENRLAEYVVHILYRSTDLSDAVNGILDLVGRNLDVSRVYIFENEDDGRCCSNTFEWCNAGVEPQKDMLQKVRYLEDLGGTYEGNFDENGVFYCRDVSEMEPQQYAIVQPQGIKSMLQCAIYDNGKFSGYVGFDECRNNRYWTQRQVDVLTFVAEILSIFLLKMRAQDRVEQNAKALENVLNNQNAWIYVIRPENMELLYLNRMTRQVAPKGRIGMRCYEVFYRRSTICGHCPVWDMRPGDTRFGQPVYSEVLEKEIQADTCWINWKGEDAVLVTCREKNEK